MINSMMVSNSNVKIKVRKNAIVKIDHSKLLFDVNEFVGDVEA